MRNNILLKHTPPFISLPSLRRDLSLAYYNYFCLDCEDCSDNSYSSSSSNSGECDHTSHPRRTLKDIAEVAEHIKSGAGHSNFQPVQNFVNVKGGYSFSHVMSFLN